MSGERGSAPEQNRVAKEISRVRSEAVVIKVNSRTSDESNRFQEYYKRYNQRKGREKERREKSASDIIS